MGMFYFKSILELLYHKAIQDFRFKHQVKYMLASYCKLERTALNTALNMAGVSAPVLVL